METTKAVRGVRYLEQTMNLLKRRPGFTLVLEQSGIQVVGQQ